MDRRRTMCQKFRNHSLTLVVFFSVLSLVPQFDRLYGAENDLLDQIIKLDEQRRAQMKTCRFEFDIYHRVGAQNAYDMIGNSWERENGKLRYLTHEKLFPEGYQLGDPVEDMVSDVYVDGDRMYEFRAPEGKYPVTDALDPCNLYVYKEEGFASSITRRSKERDFDTKYPLPVLPIPGFDKDVPLREIFNQNPPAKITEQTSESGDRIVHCELSGDIPDNVPNVFKSWDLTVDFNLSKGGAIIGYAGTWYLEDKTQNPSHMSCAVSKLQEYGNGVWLPQEFETSGYGQDKENASVFRTVFTSVSLNEKFPTPIDDFDFPKGAVVYEWDPNTDKMTFHLWGQSKPEKTWESQVDFLKELESYCFPDGAPYKRAKEVSPIRYALLILGVLLIAVGIYVRQRSRKQKE